MLNRLSPHIDMFSEGVEVVASAAFRNSDLTSIVVPDGVHTIGVEAFAGCRALVSIQLPPSLRSIRTHAFRDCDNLVAIELPLGLESIGSHAFFGCAQLAALAIPTSVRHIGSGAFKFCTSLAAVELPPRLSAIPAELFCCAALSSVVIPEGVERIEKDAFAYCEDLGRVVVPESVNWVADGAFRECSNLHWMVLPGDTAIHYDAFKNCSHLTGIECPRLATRIFGLRCCPRLQLALVSPSILWDPVDRSHRGCTVLVDSPENRLIARGLRFWSRQTHALCSPRRRAKALTFVLAVRRLATQGIVVPEEMWLCILECIEK